MAHGSRRPLTTWGCGVRYFLSYTWRYVALPCDPPRFGCCVINGEHPVDAVNRWNNSRPERVHVLLWWRELAPGESSLEIDRET
jgi:hypothetical protein